MAGTELEFIVFRDTYEDAWRKGYRDLMPANQYNVDYSMLGTARVEPLIRRDPQLDDGRRACASRTRRASATSASTRSTSATTDALTTADDHVDLQERGQGDRRPGGHVDHVHGQVRRARGQLVPHPLLAGERRRLAVFGDDQALFESFVAGQLALPARADAVLRAEHQLVQALRSTGSFAPTAVAWGKDNRTCSMRVVGHGPVAARREPRCRAPTSTPTWRSPR